MYFVSCWNSPPLPLHLFFQDSLVKARPGPETVEPPEGPGQVLHAQPRRQALERPGHVPVEQYPVRRRVPLALPLGVAGDHDVPGQAPHGGQVPPQPPPEARREPSRVDDDEGVRVPQRTVPPRAPAPYRRADVARVGPPQDRAHDLDERAQAVALVPGRLGPAPQGVQAAIDAYLPRVGAVRPGPVDPPPRGTVPPYPVHDLDLPYGHDGRGHVELEAVAVRRRGEEAKGVGPHGPRGAAGGHRRGARVGQAHPYHAPLEGHVRPVPRRAEVVAPTDAHDGRAVLAREADRRLHRQGRRDGAQAVPAVDQRAAPLGRLHGRDRRGVDEARGDLVRVRVCPVGPVRGYAPGVGVAQDRGHELGARGGTPHRREDAAEEAPEVVRGDAHGGRRRRGGPRRVRAGRLLRGALGVPRRR
mmetsp:Transcript_21388/g.48266  ORF Transcript_21388/g.48266 Transcript_21388/m.48266 type:complete len:416 (-) Transcript_21388:228-1475(-)